MSKKRKASTSEDNTWPGGMPVPSEDNQSAKKKAKKESIVTSSKGDTNVNLNGDDDLCFLDEMEEFTSEEAKNPASASDNNSSSNSSNASISPLSPAQETKQNRVNICAGNPTQEIVYKDSVYGVDLKVMQASCKHPVYVTDEISSAASPGHIWTIDAATMDVSPSAMKAFLQAVHRPFKMKKSKHFVRWAQFCILADYFQHQDLYDLAQRKCNNAADTVFNWSEWQELVYITKRRQLPPKGSAKSAIPDRAWNYCVGVAQLCQMLGTTGLSDERKTHLRNFTKLGLPQLSEATVRDVLLAFTADDWKDANEVAVILSI